MVQSRLFQLFEAAQRRSKRSADPSDESDEARNRRVLLAALKQQQAEQVRNTGPHTRYVGNNGN